MGKTVSGVLAARLGEALAGEHPGAGRALEQTGGDERPLATAEEEPAVTPADAGPAQDGPAQVGPAQDASGADAPVPDGGPVPDDGPLTLAEPDPLLAGAVERAREAASEVAGASVGEHLGAAADGPVLGGPVVTHSFATSDRAYVGWRWAVTLARAEGSEHVTVDEVVLLPGEGALLAPEWLPWNERVRSGDIGPGDLLPPPPDDERLVPSYAAPDGPDAALADAAVLELGLGRPRVLSLEGRLDAAQRWWDGEAGPDAPLARQAPGRCVDCGFLVPLGGALRQAFGVCANAVAPDDGRVVALAHGCGAHSETVAPPQHGTGAGMAVQDDEFEMVPPGS